MPQSSSMLDRIASGVVWTTVVLVSGFLGLIVLAAIAFTRCSTTVPSFVRQALDPIPIDPDACPYVRSMHAAAGAFKEANPSAHVVFDTTPPRLDAPWPTIKAHADRSMLALEQSIERALPHFPKRVRHELTITRDALRDGRDALRQSKNFDDASRRTSDIESRGTTAFGNASDLIGSACTIPLGV